LILKALGIQKGSGVPNKTKVGTLTKAQLKAIAEQKMPDLTAASVEAAMRTIAARPGIWVSKLRIKLLLSN